MYMLWQRIHYQIDSIQKLQEKKHVIYLRWEQRGPFVEHAILLISSIFCMPLCRLTTVGVEYFHPCM